MEVRTNITNNFKLPVKYDMIVETNWNNNSKPASKTPSKIPSKKPSAKRAGSSKAGPSSSKVAASKSGSASKPAEGSSRQVAGSSSRPAAGSSSRPAAGSSSRPAARSSSRPAAGSASRPVSGTSSRPKSGGGVKTPSKSGSVGSSKGGGSKESVGKAEVTSTTSKAAYASLSKVQIENKEIAEKKSPQAIPSDAEIVKLKESEIQKEKLIEKRTEEKPIEKRTEENLNEDQERRLTFCRTKQKKSIVLSECAPQATAYLEAVKKVFKEKDFASERNIRFTCAGNCPIMLIPKEVPPEKKKSDELAKRLTSADNCGNTGKSKENRSKMMQSSERI